MKTLRSAPALKAKAANAIVVVEWLADYCAQQAAAAPDIDYCSDRATMLWGLTSINKNLAFITHVALAVAAARSP